MPTMALSIAREGHRKIMRGTSSANTQENNATTENLITINHVSLTYREPSREICSQRDWFASEHDAKRLQKARIELLKRDWR